MKFKNILVIVLIISISIFMYLFLLYEKEYYGKIGLEYNSTLQDAIDKYGNPKSILKDEYGNVHLLYDDFKLSYSNYSPIAKIYQITILTDKYHFRNFVSVGSTKSEVLRAYAFCECSSDEGWIFIENNIRVEFIFEYGIVKEIHISEMD